MSDRALLTGLDPAKHKMVTVSACTDMNSRLVSGVTTTYAVWEAGEQTRLLRMNLLGRTTVEVAFNDN